MKQKIVIFGTGLFYLRRREFLPENAEIIAFLDNDPSMEQQMFEGVKVYNPAAIDLLSFDLIVLASLSWVEMKKQLLDIGIRSEKIMFWDEYISRNSHGILIKYEAEKTVVLEKRTKNILIVSYIVNYSGGFLAAFNAAIALKKMGYEVTIASGQVLGGVVEEVNQRGIDVWLCPALPYVEETELKWFRNFDYVITNSLQTIVCAGRVAPYIPTMLWLHEYSGIYGSVLAQFEKDICLNEEHKLKVCAVSDLARTNFERYFPKQKVEILPFGLEDSKNIQKKEKMSKIIFAIIGNISELKNQKFLVNVLEKLPQQIIRKVECWIIGRDGGKKYKEEIVSLVKDKSYVKLCGEYSRKEIFEIFPQIDVIVCTSKEETMSMAIIEGMMNGKICITNSNTGVANYIQSGKNGFVYEPEKKEDLLSVIEYIVANFDYLNSVKEQARKTYENYFSMNVFSEHLLEILMEKNEN